MLSLEVRTKLPEQEAAKRVKDFFGSEVGLDIVSDAPQSLGFEGGGGYVHAQIGSQDGQTVIELETREWERQVMKFAEKVG